MWELHHSCTGATTQRSISCVTCHQQYVCLGHLFCVPSLHSNSNVYATREALKICFWKWTTWCVQIICLSLKPLGALATGHLSLLCPVVNNNCYCLVLMFFFQNLGLATMYVYSVNWMVLVIHLNLRRDISNLYIILVICQFNYTERLILLWRGIRVKYNPICLSLENCLNLSYQL